MVQWIGGGVIAAVGVMFIWFLWMAIQQSKNYEHGKKKKRKGYW